MGEEKKALLSVDEYIEQFQGKTRSMLFEMRRAIQRAAPNAKESMAWSMPLFSQNGFLVQFAAHKKHIGFYCSPGAIDHFKEELQDYKTNEKNTIQFPLNKEIPIQLVERIVTFRIEENEKTRPGTQS